MAQTIDPLAGVGFEIHSDLHTTLADYMDALDEGFEEVLERWGEEDALPYLADAWPRPEWAPLAASTLRAKSRKGQSTIPLIATGALYRAATVRDAPGNIFEVEPFRIRLGVDEAVLPYALFIEQGTKTMPGREFLTLGDEPIEMLHAMIAVETEQRLARRAR